jgi:outer membrane protein OmpA-like peptidoglycan-associated protein
VAALAAVTADTPLDAALAALNLPTVNFATGSAEMPPDAKSVLQKAAAVIRLLPASVRLEVAGHTDNVGTPEGNMVLSRRRGQAVADFLVDAGVPRERIVAQGYGDTRPVVPNNSEENRFRNRRIEIKALGN